MFCQSVKKTENYFICTHFTPVILDLKLSHSGAYSGYQDIERRAEFFLPPLKILLFYNKFTIKLSPLYPIVVPIQGLYIIIHPFVKFCITLEKS